MPGPRSRSRSLRTWTEIRLRAETDAVEHGGCGRDRQRFLSVNGLPTVTAPSVNGDGLRERIAGPFGLADPDSIASTLLWSPTVMRCVP
jgi:hypothetical protein